jgi:hypothetical protein
VYLGLKIYDIVRLTVRTLHLMTSKASAISMIVLKCTFFRYLPMAQIAEADPNQINQVKYINRLDYPFS